MKYCPQCEKEFPSGQRCPTDGALLIDQTPRPDALIGKTIAGAYRVEERIARGGMGTVYRARAVKDRRHVAVKILHNNLQEDADAVKRFFREAKALSQLRHPHIVEFLDAGQTDDGQVFIAMEFLFGQTLDQVVRSQGPLGLDVAVGMMSEICEAVGVAHGEGVVHRDLTPQNIILAKQADSLQWVKIVDFGIAKRVDSMTELTAHGMVMGTPGFLAPEQITGESAVDPRSDVYALGALMHFCLSGDRPFAGPSPQAILTKQLTQEPEPLDVDRLNVPAAMRAVVKKAMARKAADRYQSAAELLTAMQGASGRRVISEQELSERITRTLRAYKRTVPPGGGTPAFGVPTGNAPITARLLRVRSEHPWFALFSALALIGAASLGAVSLIKARAPEPAARPRAPAEPIYVGFSADFSGVARENGRALHIGIKTAFRSVNDDEGGVYGRPLQVVALDDGADPSRAAQNAIELVEKRAVVAVVANLGAEGVSKALPELVGRDKLLFGAVSGALELRHSPMPKHLFFYRPSYATEVQVVIDHLLNDRHVPANAIAVYSEEGAGGDDCARAAVHAIAQAGSLANDDVLWATSPHGSEDVSAAIDKLKPGQHPALKALVVCAHYRPAARVVEEFRAKKQQLLFAGVSMLAGSAFEDRVGEVLPGFVVSQVVPSFNGDSDFLKRFRELVQLYYPENRLGFFVLEGYVVGRLFAMAMKIAGENPTTEQLISAIESMHDVELGMGAAIGFSPMRHVGSRAVWLTTWDDKLQVVPLAGPIVAD